MPTKPIGPQKAVIAAVIRQQESKALVRMAFTEAPEAVANSSPKRITSKPFKLLMHNAIPITADAAIKPSPFHPQEE